MDKTPSSISRAWTSRSALGSASAALGCGAVLIDYDLGRIAVPEGQDPRPGTFPVGGLIEVDGPVSVVRPHMDGDQLPPEACAQIDHEVTGVRRPGGGPHGGRP